MDASSRQTVDNNQQNHATTRFPLLPSMRITHSTCVDRRMFINQSNVRIIGQAHQQMIIVLLKSGGRGSQVPLILAFDQHAVHERIRFERLHRTSFDSRTGQLLLHRVIPPMEFVLTQSQANACRASFATLERVVGLSCTLKTNRPAKAAPVLLVHAVPQIFAANYHELDLFAKYLDDSIRFIAKAENLLPADELVPGRPKLSPFLLNRLRTAACHGAIRFGDPLTRPACVALIQALARCRQSFRCAHGRLAVKPVIYLPDGEEHRHEEAASKEVATSQFMTELKKIELIFVDQDLYTSTSEMK